MKKLLHTLLRFLAVPALHMVRACYRVWLRFAEFERIGGLSVVNLAEPHEQAQVFQKIREAVTLIERAQPFRLAQAVRYLRRVVISHTGGSGEYWYGMGICVLDKQFLLQRDAGWAAMTIVHEATHARLDRFGVRTTAANQARVEHLCARAESSLAAELPDGQARIEAVNQSLQRRWWEATPTRERARRRFEAWKTRS